MVTRMARSCSMGSGYEKGYVYEETAFIRLNAKKQTSSQITSTAF